MDKLYKIFTHLFMYNYIKFYFLLNIFLAKSFVPLDICHGIIIIQIPRSASKLTLIIFLPSKKSLIPALPPLFQHFSISPAAKHNPVNPHHYGSLQKELTEPPLN